MDRLYEKILNFSLEKEEIDRIHDHLGSLNESIKLAEEEIETKTGTFYKEHEDVELLENNGLRSAFLHYLGQDDTALEVEKQEMLAAFLSVEKAKKALDLLKYEKKILVRKILNFEYDEKKFGELLKLKEENLLKFPQMRIKLTLIDSKIERLKKQEVEILEASEENKKLTDLFAELYAELLKISDWNQSLVAYHGKGHYSSYKKKKYVENNIELVSKIELRYDMLEKELSDLKKKYELDFTNNLTLLSQFFNLFLDNLITDWVVKNGIISSLRTIQVCSSKTKQLQLMLDHELTLIEKEVDVLKIDREKAIVVE